MSKKGFVGLTEQESIEYGKLLNMQLGNFTEDNHKRFNELTDKWLESWGKEEVKE
jgi:hypothetical protein